MAKAKDIVGNRYGNLVVVRDGGNKRSSSGLSIHHWVCRCDCGKEILVSTSNLNSGHTTKCKKCGIKVSSEKRKTHGQANTRLYSIWTSMKMRCSCPSSTSYNRYGARGITVCDEWTGTNGFEKFAEWAMRNGYDASLTIDRIDSNKSYCPSNCRWSDAKQQSNNRRSNVFVHDTDGENLTLAMFAEKYDISYRTISSRWNRGCRDVNRLKETSVRGLGNKRVARFAS